MFGSTLLASLALFGAVQETASPQVLSDVVVSARPQTQQAARQFVDTVSTAPPQTYSLSTWRTPLCIDTENLRSEAASVIKAQVQARAANVGVALGKPSCKPNVTIIFTSDGRQTAHELLETFPDVFAASPGPTQGDDRAKARFAESGDAVRWWTTSAEFDVNMKGFINPIFNRPTPWRDTTGRAFFNQDVVQAMALTVVVVDARLTAGVPAETLGDYIAMIVLSQVDPEADLAAYPTILNLWRDGGELAMTQWDERYLEALYQARVRSSGSSLQVRSRYQLNEIARLMVDGDEAKDAVAP